MGSVWKRLQRVNKRAAKFQFTASYHELRVETTAKWRPTNLSVIWTRRSRRVASSPLPWEPDMMNPLVGHISWPVPDNHAISVTLFKDPRTHELEDKDWTFVIEDISAMGKKRILASASINMRKYASIESTQQSFTLNLKPVSRKIITADIELTISCVFLREGKATDEDMESIISMMSVNNNCDVAPLDDLEDIPDLESSGDISEHVLDFTQQLEQLTSSLNGGLDLATPMSVPSLSEDPTPLAEHNQFNFELELDKSLNDTKENNEYKNNIAYDKSPSIPVQNFGDYDDNKFNVQPLITPVNCKSPDDVDRMTQFEKTSNEIRIGQQHQQTTNTIGNGPVKLVRASLEAAEDLSTTTDMKLMDEKIEIVLSETKDENNKKQEKIEIKIIPTDNITNTSITTTTKGENDNHPIIMGSHVRETKRSELLPLNLKKNYDNNNKNKKINDDKINLKDRTPGQDLLEWCKEVTKDYPTVKVTNLTTSWRNGIAFCAIIHSFEPELIDMSKLSPHDVVGNCGMAFHVAETLGIPRVIEPRDMCLLAVPDKLAVMTYLHQLRAHFTGKQLHIEQIGQTSDESSYVIGNYKSDNLSQNILNLHTLKAQQNSFDDIVKENFDNKSPTTKKDVKNFIFTKNLLGKVLSPVRDKNTINAFLQQQPQNNRTSNNINSGTRQQNDTVTKDKPILMTRRELTDPFGSDDEDDKNEKLISSKRDIEIMENQNNQVTTPTLDPETTNKLLARHKEMREKAKAMMEKSKLSQENGKSDIDEERQQRLREHARRLIAETRLKSNSIDNSPTKSITQRITLSPERTISPINVTEGFVFNQINNDAATQNSPQQNSPNLIQQLSPSKRSQTTPPREILAKNYSTMVKMAAALGESDNLKYSPSRKLNNTAIEKNGNNNSPLQSFNSILERITPKHEKKGDKLSYIESELEALEREQESIDQKASSLEKKLRTVMGGDNSKDDETEEKLLSQWFTLVNKKNALLRRQMQLNILEQENDLERKCDLLNQELRAALSVEEWRKSEAQRQREELLLDELVTIVNKRDQLVQHLHSQEKAIEDDDEIERELEHVDISSKEKCVIQ